MTDLTYELDPARPSKIVTWNEYSAAVIALSQRLPENVLPGTGVLAGVLQGGFLVAQSLADQLGVEHVAALSADRRNGRPLLRLAADSTEVEVNIEGRTVLVVDEVIDSGRTADHFVRGLAEAGAREVILACLFQSRASIVGAIAAETYDKMPEFVLPWRLLRDFPATVKAILTQGAVTTEQIVGRLGQSGAAISRTDLETRLRELEAAGLVAWANSAWRWDG